MFSTNSMFELYMLKRERIQLSQKDAAYPVGANLTQLSHCSKPHKGRGFPGNYDDFVDNKSVLRPIFCCPMIRSYAMSSLRALRRVQPLFSEAHQRDFGRPRFCCCVDVVRDRHETWITSTHLSECIPPLLSIFRLIDIALKAIMLYSKQTSCSLWG